MIMHNKKFAVVGVQKTIMAPEITPCGEAQVLLKDEGETYYRGNSMRPFNHSDSSRLAEDFWLLENPLPIDTSPNKEEVFVLFWAKRSGNLLPAEMCRSVVSKNWFSVTQQMDFDFLLISQRSLFNAVVASNIYDYFDNERDKYQKKQSWSDILICGRILQFCGKWDRQNGNKTLKATKLIAECLYHMKYSQQQILDWLEFIQLDIPTLVPQNILNEILTSQCTWNEASTPKGRPKEEVNSLPNCDGKEAPFAKYAIYSSNFGNPIPNQCANTEMFFQIFSCHQRCIEDFSSLTMIRNSQLPNACKIDWLSRVPATSNNRMELEKESVSCPA